MPRSVPRCRSCNHLVWYPRDFCPNCGSEDVELTLLRGSGTVYSYTVVRSERESWPELVPYVVAIVELDEGPRMLAHLEGPSSDLRIGASVEVSVGDEVDAPRFRLGSARGADAKS